MSAADRSAEHGSAATSPAPGVRELGCQRAEFSLPTDIHYLNCAYIGPLPRRVEDAGVAELRRKACPTSITARDFFEPAEQARRLCAQLVGADAEHIALVPSVAYAVAGVAAQVTPRRGGNVVLPQAQFPSTVHAWTRWREHGVEVRFVPPPPDAEPRAAGWSRRLAEAIDPDTLVVAVDTVHWTDGTRFDLATIGARAREVGAVFIVDATQSAGADPVDAAAIGADLLVAHGYKAMLAGHGLGFACYSERMLGLRPLEDNWLMRRGAEDFARLVDYRDDYAAGARRFDGGSRASPVLPRMLAEAVRMLLDWDPAAIQRHCARISRGLQEDARALGLSLAPAGERAANIFGLRLPAGVDAEHLRSTLAQARVHVSIRGDAIRISPHVYNDEADLAALSAALAAGLGR